MARAKNDETVYAWCDGVEMSMDKEGYFELMTSNADIILDPGEVTTVFMFLKTYMARWKRDAV